MYKKKITNTKPKMLYIQSNSIEMLAGKTGIQATLSELCWKLLQLVNIYNIKMSLPSLGSLFIG